MKEYVDTKGRAHSENFLCLWATPNAIKDHFLGCVPTEADMTDEERWVDQASDEELVEVALAFLSRDEVWDTFHSVLMDLVWERMEA